MKQIVITGIDTDIGKTIATGLMANYLIQKNIPVITQKMVQTGCDDMAEDILLHRKLMGSPLLKEDQTGLTCPYVFKYAASPHLAAEMEGQAIDPGKIFSATRKLAENHSTILIEGAGGLFVPLNQTMMIVDYIKTHAYPVILVSSSKLGSINHTLLSIEALKTRGIELMGIVYNRYPEDDPFIGNDSIQQIASYMIKSGYRDRIVQMGKIDLEQPTVPDFDSIFEPA